MKSLILVALAIHAISAVDWIPGRGAQVAFVEVEAEHANHNGQLIGNDRHYGQLSSEASQRRAVTLNAGGQYVEFTMPIEANSVVVRYSIPDTGSGKDHEIRDADIDLYVGGAKLKPLTFTSKYSHWYGSYPFNNNPGSGNAHHFYDSVRTLLDKTYPKGTKVKLQVSDTGKSPTFTIDLADFELIGAPIAQPSGSLSVTDAAYGADPTGKTDSSKAFQKAVDDGATQKKTVYIPQGTYMIYEHVIVDGVTLTGAGPWYSVLGGRHPTDRSKTCGVYGKYVEQGGSKNVHLSNFAIIGDIRERVDEIQTNGIGGALTDTVIDNLWLQHVKVGAWLDGKMDNLVIKNCRIEDTTADGVNFHKGVTNSIVQNTFLRNTGDDGLAMWAEQYPNVNNKFINNTMGIPVLANNIAIYGGKDIEVSDNLVYDTISNGGGIHIANRYPGVQGPTGVLGHHKVYRNTMLRAGNADYNWNFGIGSIWFSGQNEEIKNATIEVKDCDIIDASYSAIMYIEGKTNGVTFDNLSINGTGTFALQLQAGGENVIKHCIIRENCK
ncbi:unnamed protein product [Oppiella nova]|uniref:Pectate lyase superfamily protein domain-containing protein n=1 Tax=Oppiella nova TaxID=334625 RepID=A0A7R9M812_9ACAR|nr:unnamed protein product [Oppiella nova]CAG2172526.1 unnamed protein product [Oppiella nova]